MTSLRRSDVLAILDLVVDLGEMEILDPYTPAMLARLDRLVPSASLSYEEVDCEARRTTLLVTPRGVADDDPEEDAVYWRLGPCPITNYRARTGDTTAKRTSDVMPWRTYRELPIYRDYFGPAPYRIDHTMTVGLEVMPGRHREIVLYRRAGDGRFTDRDVAVLDMLRPHLLRLEAGAELRRRLTELAQRSTPAVEPGQATGLTAREHEIVILVGEGKTNAEIATQLWISPATVKKHLEHVYEKLDVSGRAGAVSRVRA